MNILNTLSATTVVLCTLSGCATYSDAINTFAPEREQWQHDDYIVSDGDSAFCSKPVTEMYMVMPEEGKEGTVIVTFNDGQEVTLHGDYSAISYSEDERKTFLADEEKMKERFGVAVDALPKAPLKTTLYFLLGKEELTPKSEAIAQTIYSDILKRQAPEILVIGHTDTLGSANDNKALSIKRAEVVRNSLIDFGVEADTIKASGMGEQELAIETNDKVREPKNRRVEINVR